VSVQKVLFVRASIYNKGVCSTYPAIAGFPTQHTTKMIDYQSI